MPSDSSLAHWTEDELRETAEIPTSAGDDSQLPFDVRFKRGVHFIARKRMDHINYCDDPKEFSIFVLQPKPDLKDSDLKIEFEPFFADAHKPLAGYLWFVPEAVTSAFKLKMPTSSDGDIFSWITRIGLTELPTVVVNPSATPCKMRFYPNGFCDCDNYDVWDLSSKDVTPSEVKKVLDRIHHDCLRTPDAQTDNHKLWITGNKPFRHAEKRIQALLKPGLSTAFLDCKVREELPSSIGRLDLCIMDRNGSNTAHALLELKVLRSESSGKTTYSEKTIQEKIEEGVDQAREYQQEYNARWASLCCFDMRRADTNRACFEHVKEKAALDDILLWRWYLSSASKTCRVKP